MGESSIKTTFDKLTAQRIEVSQTFLRWFRKTACALVDCLLISSAFLAGMVGFLVRSKVNYKLSLCRYRLYTVTQNTLLPGVKQYPQCSFSPTAKTAWVKFFIKVTLVNCFGVVFFFQTEPWLNNKCLYWILDGQCQNDKLLFGCFDIPAEATHVSRQYFKRLQTEQSKVSSIRCFVLSYFI